MARKLLISLTLVAALLPPALRAQQPDEDDLAAAQALDLPSPLEQAESLEQLRALENGIAIRIVEVDYRGRSAWSVDAPSDVDEVEAIIAREGELVS